MFFAFVFCQDQNSVWRDESECFKKVILNLFSNTLYKICRENAINESKTIQKRIKSFYFLRIKKFKKGTKTINNTTRSYRDTHKKRDYKDDFKLFKYEISNLNQDFCLDCDFKWLIKLFDKARKKIMFAIIKQTV